jgi:hypothetical protein
MPSGVHNPAFLVSIQSGTKATLHGKALTLAFNDTNTFSATTPAPPTGRQLLVLTNPDGESVSPDATFVAQ